MKALFKNKNNKPFIKEIELKSLNKNDVKVKILMSGICRTDIYVAEDKIYKNRIVINHKDRLLRFGSEIIFQLCHYFGIEVVIIEKSEANFEMDLVSSVIEIITVFSSKLYGSRSHKNKKTVELTA